MRTPLKTTLALAIPFASLLWMTPPAVAHDYGYRQPYGQRHSWYDSRRPYGQRRSWYDSHRYSYPNRYSGENRWKYNKALSRLARQEREARAKAYRRYEGNDNNQRYRERLAEIDRRYDHKRDKVDRNLRDR